MPKNRALTKSQQDNLRNTIARSLGQHIRKLNEHIDGEIELSASQVKAIQMLMGKVVPDLSSTQVEDITEPTHDKAAIEAAYTQAIQTLKAQLKPEDIADTLKAMTPETRQALIDSIQAQETGGTQ
jgi:hypothetical protein